MDYFHVFVKEGNGRFVLFRQDMTADSVEKLIAQPFSRGHAISNAAGRIVQTSSLSGLRICRTDSTFEQTFERHSEKWLREQNALNAGSRGAVLLNLPPEHDDMANVWPDSTKHFLGEHGPGSHKPSRFGAMSNNRLLVAVITLFCAALLSYCGFRA